MRIGFTGTRRGMTDAQKGALCFLLDAIVAENPGGVEGHHGDCVGADAEFHFCVVKRAGRTVVHPPADDKLRAFCDGDECLPTKTHFARNRDIVNGTDLLIGCPADMTHRSRGGTWYTIDYAQKVGKPAYIVLPDGTIEDRVDAERSRP